VKTKLIAIAATAAVALAPLAGVAAASATTEEASWPVTSQTAAGPTTTTPAASTPAAVSPSEASSADADPAATAPAAGSSSSKETSNPTSPSSSPSPSSECTVANRSHIHAERVGPSSFRAWVDAGYECGAWVTTFAFDDGYVPTSTDDYRHPQTALEWGYAQLTTTPTVHAVPAPKCGPFQSDLTVGPLVLKLSSGELGSQWRAGVVVLSNPDCAPTEEPSSNPTPGPTQTPTHSPTSEPSPTATGSTGPSPSSTTPAGSTPTGSAPTTGASTNPTAARESQRIAQTVAPQSDALAYTGSAAIGWGVVAAIALLVVGAYLVFRARLKAIDRKRRES
jgi:hypothetical protein